MLRSNTIEKFHTKYKIDPSTDCWEWQGYRLNGYGQWHWDSKRMYAHRFSAQQYIGSIEGKTVCHKCDNPCCVNPKHLYIGTMADNMRDMVNKGRDRRGINPARGINSNNKLTEQDVLNIRADTTTSYKDLATQYKVNYYTIKLVQTRTTWKHI